MNNNLLSVPSINHNITENTPESENIALNTQIPSPTEQALNISNASEPINTTEPINTQLVRDNLCLLETNNIDSPFSYQINTLISMGYSDVSTNQFVLELHNGDIDSSIEFLESLK